MSEFHENIRSILEDVHAFLQYTLRKEVLSTSCITLKEELLLKIKQIGHEYPQLHLTASSPYPGSSSPPPYIDMQTKNVGTHHNIPILDTHYYDVTDETEYEVVSPVSEHNFPIEVKTEIAEIEEEKEIVPVPALDLHNILKSGFLEKKGKERLGGFFTASQKRWCAIQDGIFRYYDRPTDKRQKGQINLSGYEARPVAEYSVKDGGMSKACFELVCPGRRTYQFIALSVKDMKQWISAIEECQSRFSTVVKQDIVLGKEITDEEHVDDPDGIYESLEGNFAVPKNPSESLMSPEPDYDEGLSLGVGKEEDLYADAESMSILNQVMEVSKKFSISSNHSNSAENSPNPCSHPTNESQTNTVVYVEGEGPISNPCSWFIGMWDCQGSTKNELNFKRGDLIKIVSKQYDSYSWWIGELDGRIGLIPKNYLTNAYEQVVI